MIAPLIEAGFEKRKSQERMMEKISSVLGTEKLLFLCAPTGTGKTFAYLIPVISSGKRVLVSTYSRLLQEQLLDDVRKISQIYGKDISAGVWKGVTSFICRLKLEEDPDPEIVTHAEERGGDIFRMDIENERLRRYVVDDEDDCEGCVREDCFYKIARNRALCSDITIVNHHILARFFPSGYDLVIIDEGHEFPEVLIESQSVGFSEKTIKEFTGVGEVTEKNLPEVLALLEKEFLTLKMEAKDRISKLIRYSSPARITSATERGIKKYIGVEIEEIYEVNDDFSTLDGEIWKVLRRVKRLRTLIQKIRFYLTDRPGYEKIVSDRGKWKTFRAVPLFADFKAFVGNKKVPVVFVSATLEPDYMEMMLGIDEDDYEYESFPPEWKYDFGIEVFDVHPREDRWKNALQTAVRSAEDEFSRVIVLLTNKEHLDLVDTDLKQGKTGLKTLLEKFREEGGVLAGVETFWKGIDVPGNKAVVIGKLPFPNPDDRLHEKRCEFLRTYYGENQMWKYIKSVAKMNLRQGIGRLKRRREDTGKIYLVDNRVFSRFFSEFLAILREYGRVRRLSPESVKSKGDS